MPLAEKELINRAKALPLDQRRGIISSLPETELHRHLLHLFRQMEPGYFCEITHGAGELGKDLIIIKKDTFGIDVTGVIVKAGSIKGKTAGDVDAIKGKVKATLTAKDGHTLEEIASQIEQTAAHPAESKAFFQRLPVNNFLVIVSGEFGSHARERLEKELAAFDRPITIRDVAWLIECFSNHYPQIFFEGRALDFLNEKIISLEIQFNSKRGKNLSDYFVEPIVAPMAAGIIGKDAPELNLQEKISFSALKTLLSGQKRIFLIGDPGSGKSGALAKITVDFLRHASNHIFQGAPKSKKIGIPLFLTAAQAANSGAPDDVIKEYFIAPEIQTRFKINTVLVDGLDEVPADQRPAVIDKARLISTNLACSLVITSRRIDILETGYPDFEKYEVLHFQFGQAMQLFKKVVSTSKTLESLKDGLERIKNQIPMIPLSLMFLVELAEDNKEIPASLTELYDRYYDMALGKWDKDKGIAVLFEYLIKKKFIATLAYQEFFLKNRFEITAKEFDDFIRSYAKKFSINENALQIFRRELDRANVLDTRDAIFFKHRSILDYFTAYYIHDKRAEFKDLETTIAETYFSDLWSDVAFFYIGLRREITPSLISLILDKEDEELRTLFLKFMVGRLLQAGWYSESETKYKGLKRVVGFGPTIRQKLLDESAELPTPADMPAIFADVVVFSFSHVSFSSGFLASEATKLCDEFISLSAPEDIYRAILLLFAANRFIKPKDKDRLAKLIYTKIELLPPTDKTRSLIVMMFVEKDNAAKQKSIKHQLNKFLKKHPDVKTKLFATAATQHKLVHKK